MICLANRSKCSCRSVTAPTIPDCEQNSSQVLYRGQWEQDATCSQWRDGGEFPVEIGLNPIETEQGTMVLAALIDISDRKRMEERIHSVNTMLAHMNRVATAGELSSSIAHEIRQPLAAVVAHANAGVRWLTKETPDIDEALAALRATAPT